MQSCENENSHRILRSNVEKCILTAPIGFQWVCSSQAVLMKRTINRSSSQAWTSTHDFLLKHFSLTFSLVYYIITIYFWLVCSLFFSFRLSYSSFSSFQWLFPYIPLFSVSTQLFCSHDVPVFAYFLFYFVSPSSSIHGVLFYFPCLVSCD